MPMYNEGLLPVFGNGPLFSHVYDDFGFIVTDENI